MRRHAVSAGSQLHAASATTSLAARRLAPSKDQPANRPPWGGVRPAAWPPPPLESERSLAWLLTTAASPPATSVAIHHGFQQLACVLTYAWSVSRCETNI
jgi:hypothetical protein